MLFRAFCFLAAVSCAVGFAEEPRPNILLIVADDLGYGDLSCYGATDLRSPNIDRLAGRGMSFENFYANCPVCSPTRASLLTGRYPDVVGVPGVIRTHPQNSWGYLDPEAVTLPALFKEAGYRTACVGKWHLGLERPNTPNERGFDHFHGFLGDMMDDYYHHRRHGVNYMRLNGQRIDPEGHATDLFTDWAADYLKDHAQNHQAKPFFLYLAYNAPHTPIQPPEDWLAKVKRREPEMDERRARLVALIEHMDDGIGRVLETLESTGLAGETLVVFTSDNGGQLSVGANNGPLRNGKQSMYEGGLKVPTIVAWPERIAAGKQSDRIALSMDLYPTLLAAAGVDHHHKIDGLSFLPALKGEEPAPERPLFFVRREGGTRYGGKTIHAVRQGDWKLVHDSPWAPAELYHLGDDPKEQRDLASGEPKKYRELMDLLMGHIQRAGAVAWQSPEEHLGRLELLDVRRVWNRGAHNAFTDLIRFRDDWYLTFREAPYHGVPDVGQEPGRARVLRSKDGEQWESVALLDWGQDQDVRDPKLSITADDRLMLNAAAAPHAKKGSRQSLAWFSKDGESWEGPEKIGELDYWMWRVTWGPAGAAYGVGYGPTGASPRTTRLYRSENGIEFDVHVPTLTPEAQTNETTVRFLRDKTAVALVRREGDRPLARVGVSRGDYTDWTFRELSVRLGGPDFIELPDGRIVAGGRLYDKTRRMGLGWLDPERGTFDEELTLPSGGDTSYPGFVYHDGVLWVSYYSSHEGKSSIYLARVKVFP